MWVLFVCVCLVEVACRGSTTDSTQNCEEKLSGEPLLPCLMQPLTRFREYVHYTKLLVQWTSRSNPEYAELAVRRSSPGFCACMVCRSVVCLYACVCVRVVCCVRIVCVVYVLPPLTSP